jgi:hypothetical protein
MLASTSRDLLRAGLKTLMKALKNTLKALKNTLLRPR